MNFQISRSRHVKFYERDGFTFTLNFANVIHVTFTFTFHEPLPAKSQMRRDVHNLSSSSHQRVLSISLRTAHERGGARRRCYSIGAVAQLYCTAVVPKRSRDSVTDDVAFRRPAVELLVITMHSWALPCHTKSGFRTPSSTSYWLKLCHDVFDASANHIPP